MSIASAKPVTGTGGFWVDSLRPPRGALRRLLCLALLLLAPSAQAAGFQDAMADVVAVVVLIIVPIGAIVVFWLVHVLPEKIAHKRHHPQTAAITTLCLLSLVFGGLLWPLAWLWAFTKPVGYRLAYGTDKHEGYFDEMGDKYRSGTLLNEDLRHLRDDLQAMEARGALPPRLKTLKEELERVRPDTEAPTATAAPQGNV
jgi:hypothetical protein